MPEHIETIAPKLPGVKILGKIDLNLFNPLKKTSSKSISQQHIDNAFNMAVNKDTGITVLSLFHESLKQVDPTFNYRDLGFSSFRKFCESLAPTYAIVMREDGTMSLKKSE
ncbi:MAG: OST-HTH/LOTUS domain-containing protein [Prevotellaceae bacterium]|jgi:ribosomal protein S7|nr:OST-HTH/LOTUS domain-containing protein [Prevotellaceae bacterium]